MSQCTEEVYSSISIQFKPGAPGREGEGGAVAGVCPDRARSLASMALPVARHAGFCKFKEFQSRARTQAHDRERGTRCSHRFFPERS